MNVSMNPGAIFAFAWMLALPGAAQAQPPITSPEQMAATRELFDLHALGGHRNRSGMSYSSFNDGSELNCVDSISTGEKLVYYPLTSPSHLYLERVQVWGFESLANSDSLRVRVLSICHGQGNANPPTTLIRAQAGLQPGQFARVYFDLQVGLFGAGTDCTDTVEIRFASSGQVCQGSGRSVMRVRAQAFNPEHIFRDGFVPRVNLSQSATNPEARP